MNIDADLDRVITVHELTTGNTFEEESDIVVSAKGILNEPKWPNVPGLKDFGGELMHSAAWKEGCVS